MPPKIATTTVISAMSARFFMLIAASRCIGRFSQGHASGRSRAAGNRRGAGRGRPHAVPSENSEVAR
jgi:hypothetical protein